MDFLGLFRRPPSQETYHKNILPNSCEKIFQNLGLSVNRRDKFRDRSGRIWELVDFIQRSGAERMFVDMNFLIHPENEVAQEKAETLTAQLVKDALDDGDLKKI